MLPLLAGALAVESVDTVVIANILRYGLMVLGASLVADALKDKKKAEAVASGDFLKKEQSKKVKKVDVFTSKSQIDILTEQKEEKKKVSTETTSEGSSPTDDIQTSGENEGGVSNTGSPSFSLEVSTGGDSLLDVLKGNGEITKAGFENVIGSLEGLRQTVDVRLRGVENALRGINSVSNSTQILQALQGLGAILGALAMSLEGIRVKLGKLDDIAENGRKLSDVFTTPVSVNPEEYVTTASNPIEMIAKALGVQAKTFVDINTFDADEDIPDLPDGIDISQIFKFLRVSSQISGG